MINRRKGNRGGGQKMNGQISRSIHYKTSWLTELERKFNLIMGLLFHNICYNYFYLKSYLFFKPVPKGKKEINKKNLNFHR